MSKTSHGRHVRPPKEVRDEIDVARDRCPTSGKVAFRRRKDAEAQATRESKKSGKPLYAYCCRDCGQWHVTSSRPRRPQERG